MFVYYNQGYAARIFSNKYKNGICCCPHDKGSKEYREYMKGWESAANEC